MTLIERVENFLKEHYSNAKKESEDLREDIDLLVKQGSNYDAIIEKLSYKLNSFNDKYNHPFLIITDNEGNTIFKDNTYSDKIFKLVQNLNEYVESLNRQ
jgi:archaellum component FlaC